MARTTLLCLLLLSPALVPQNGGTLGSNGLEPLLSVSSSIVGQPSQLLIQDLVPAPAPSLLLALSTQTGQASLASSGWPGLVLGLSATPQTGFFWLSPPMQVAANGQLALPFLPASALLGQTFFLQAVNIDPLAPAGAALSDVVSVTFALTNEHVVASQGNELDGQQLLHLFTDGVMSQGTAPSLDEVEILDLQLTASLDTLPLCNAVPLEDRSSPGRPRIILPGGASFYSYVDISDRHGFFVVERNGGGLHGLLQSSHEFRPEVAASAFGPYVAVVSESTLSGFGNAHLFLLRTDGQNFPGSASPVHPVFLTGLLAGESIRPSSMTFLDGALLFVAGDHLVRLPTDLSSGAAAVTLPPSGGQVPTELDQELAWSADGSSAAFSAGSGTASRDIYVLHATGAAINVTADPAPYLAVNYQGAVLRGRLALSPDGSRVAYLKIVNGETDLLVQNVPAPAQGAPAAPITLTGSNVFAGYIETEAGIWMTSNQLVVFHAGHDVMSKDLYYAVVPQNVSQPFSVFNITNTSGTQFPPFVAASGLTVDNVARTPGGGILFEMHPSAGGVGMIVGTLGPGQTPSVLVPGISGVAAAAPAGPMGYLATQSPLGAHMVEIGPGGSLPIFNGHAGSVIRSLLTDPLSGQAILTVDQNGGTEPFLMTQGGKLHPLSGLADAAALRPEASFLDAGRILLTLEGQAGGSTVYLVDVEQDLGSPLLTTAGTVLFY